MTDDRELLELAARAADINGEWQDYAKGIVMLPPPAVPSSAPLLRLEGI